MRYAVSGLFIAIGVALLLLPNTFMIRGTDISFGWLALGVGVLSLGFDIAKGRREARGVDNDRRAAFPDERKDDEPGGV